MTRQVGAVAGAIAVLMAAGTLMSCKLPLEEYRTAAAAAAAPITLEWDAVSGDVAGYKVHVGGSSKNYFKTIEAGNSTTCVVSSLIWGATYFFAVSAYAADGTESGLSNEISYVASK